MQLWITDWTDIKALLTAKIQGGKSFDAAMSDIRDEQPELYQRCSRHMSQSADHVHELLNM